MITVIGAGPMGTALTRAFNAAGHRAATISLRDGCSALRIARAQLVVCALPVSVALALTPGLPDGGRRILVDVTNPPFQPTGRRSLAGRSIGEQLSELLPTWRVVKAFNTVPAALVGSPRLQGARVTVPVAGDDPLARRSICHLAAQLGFHAVDAGDLASSQAIEGLAMLMWRISASHGHRGRAGFRLLTAEPAPEQDRPGDCPMPGS